MLHSFLIFALLSCTSNRYLTKDILPSESPCVDGTIVNIKEHNCKLLYWKETLGIVKLRCTYAREDTIWSQSSFYVVPLSLTREHVQKGRLYCKDDHFSVFIK